MRLWLLQFFQYHNIFFNYYILKISLGIMKITSNVVNHIDLYFRDKLTKMKNFIIFFNLSLKEDNTRFSFSYNIV